MTVGPEMAISASGIASTGNRQSIVPTVYADVDALKSRSIDYATIEPDEMDAERIRLDV